MTDVVLHSSLPRYKNETDAKNAQDVQQRNHRLSKFETTEIVAVIANQLETGEPVGGLHAHDVAPGQSYEDIARSMVYKQKTPDLYVLRVVDGTQQHVKVDTVKPIETEN
jgi:hypothetical protein